MIANGMKLISIIISLIILTSCEEDVPVDPFAVSDKTRDSIYLKVQELYVSANYKEAEKLLNTIHARDMYDYNYYSYNARVKFNLQKYSEAIHFINSALRANHSASIYFIKASCFESLNLMDSAIVSLNKAIELDSTNARYIKSRIQYYLANKLPLLALDDAYKLLQIDSNNLHYQTYVGFCKFEFGDTNGSIKTYESILKKDAGNLDALKSLGFIALRKNKMSQAKAYFNKYLDIEPTNGEIFFGMAQILSDEKKFDKACDCLLKSIEFGYEEAYKHAYKCEEQFKKKGVQIKIHTDTLPKTKDNNTQQI